MLNKKTNSKNYWKTLVILPFLVGFIYSCNQKTETKVKEIASNDAQFTPLTNPPQPTHKDSITTFIQPIHSSDLERIASGYGMRMHPVLKYKKMHNGVDYIAPKGTPVYATSTGKVIFSKRENGYGNVVKIKHNQGYESIYCHLNSLLVKEGEQVEIGKQIATVGNTGLSTGPHLHFEMLKDGKHLDPKMILPYENDDSKTTLD